MSRPRAGEDLRALAVSAGRPDLAEAWDKAQAELSRLHEQARQAWRAFQAVNAECEARAAEIRTLHMEILATADASTSETITSATTTS